MQGKAVASGKCDRSRRDSKGLAPSKLCPAKVHISALRSNPRHLHYTKPNRNHYGSKVMLFFCKNKFVRFVLISFYNMTLIKYSDRLGHLHQVSRCRSLLLFLPIFTILVVILMYGLPLFFIIL